MDRLQTFDLVIFLALLAMFVVGYAQGVVRRLLGIGAILFSLFLAVQLREPLGSYLAKEWSGLAPSTRTRVPPGCSRCCPTATRLSRGS